jgi:hypothetical protein
VVEVPIQFDPNVKEKEKESAALQKDPGNQQDSEPTAADEDPDSLQDSSPEEADPDSLNQPCNDSQQFIFSKPHLGNQGRTPVNASGARAKSSPTGAGTLRFAARKDLS